MELPKIRHQHFRRDDKLCRITEDLRLAFHLTNPRRLYDSLKGINLPIDYAFTETMLEELYKK